MPNIRQYIARIIIYPYEQRVQEKNSVPSGRETSGLPSPFLNNRTEPDSEPARPSFPNALLHRHLLDHTHASINLFARTRARPRQPTWHYKSAPRAQPEPDHQKTTIYYNSAPHQVMESPVLDPCLPSSEDLGFLDLFDESGGAHGKSMDLELCLDHLGGFQPATRPGE
jgi:hypothetical protein